MKRRICVGVLATILMACSILGVGLQEVRTVEDRLIAFTHQIRLGLTLATIAAHSPTLSDVRLHAQQLVNLLEGAEGRHFAEVLSSPDVATGLVLELAAMKSRLENASLPDTSRRLVLTSARNVSTFLDLALSAALESLDARQIDIATADMLRAYAFLLAAYEMPCDTTYVPALWTILGAYDLTESIELNP